ncbi:MAG: hypothetical protein MHM6MM_002664 [Cercozoa sp. M6MM]
MLQLKSGALDWKLFEDSLQKAGLIDVNDSAVDEAKKRCPFSTKKVDGAVDNDAAVEKCPVTGSTESIGAEATSTGCPVMKGAEIRHVSRGSRITIEFQLQVPWSSDPIPVAMPRKHLTAQRFLRIYHKLIELCDIHIPNPAWRDVQLRSTRKAAPFDAQDELTDEHAAHALVIETRALSQLTVYCMPMGERIVLHNVPRGMTLRSMKLAVGKRIFKNELEVAIALNFARHQAYATRACPANGFDAERVLSNATRLYALNLRDSGDKIILQLPRS